MGAPFNPIARIPIPAQMVRVVIRLHHPVLLDDPGHLGPHVRPQNTRRNLGVIVRSQLIPDVVNQCRNQQFLVGPVGVSPRGRLQTNARAD